MAVPASVPAAAPGGFPGPVRVLFVSHDTDLFGAQRVLLTLLKEIDRRVCTPHLLVPYDGPMAGMAVEAGVPVFIERMVHWVPGSSVVQRGQRLRYLNGFLRTLNARCRAIENRIAEQRIDMVYTNTVTCVEGAIAARRIGKPHIWHIHEHIVGNGGLLPLLPYRIYCAAMDALSDSVIFCSKALAHDYPRMHGKATVVYSGIPFADPRDRGAAREKYSGEFGIDPAVKVVAVAGVLEPGKDLLTFLAAAERLARALRDVVFLIVGKGDAGYTALLRRRIEELGLESKVMLLGWRNDLRDILAATDVLVISSERESFGLTAVEALAAETPVVATRCGGPEEVVTEGETGFLVPVKDARAMADAVGLLLQERELARRMGVAGKLRVSRLYGEGKFLRCIERVIRDAALPESPPNSRRPGVRVT
jgi:glycosyltransferase involved in cell wall biosynthesis